MTNRDNPVVFTKLYQGCCGEHIIDLAGQGCCHSKPHNLEEQDCCDGQIQDAKIFPGMTTCFSFIGRIDPSWVSRLYFSYNF